MYTFCASIENLVTIKSSVIKPTNLDLTCRKKKNNIQNWIKWQHICKDIPTDIFFWALDGSQQAGAVGFFGAIPIEMYYIDHI